jgi:hypothetical protein
MQTSSNDNLVPSGARNHDYCDYYSSSYNYDNNNNNNNNDYEYCTATN